MGAIAGWLVLAFAVPAGGAPTAADTLLQVAAWPDAVLTEWPAHAKRLGQTGRALEPACEQAAPGLQQCLMLQEDGRRRLATAADLDAHGGQVAASRKAASIGRAALAGLSEMSVPEMPGRTIHVRSVGDGLDSALVAAPDAVHARFGASTVMAFPDVTTTLVWNRGDPDLDKMLAVAVRRAWEAADRPVSPRVYRWDGESLVEWAAARPAEPPPP
ncbi:MAG: hypothetical protein VX265_16620 [Myxococcota bacterium]|nr:hypothetical protein [Myxococcota bacterium]MEC8424997.1 hypothetical protein [Myxococcota bacterium]